MSVASIIDICNLGLSHLGAGAIQTLTENNPRAQACNRHYNSCRDLVLRQIKPTCCKERQASLAQDVETPAWQYAFAYTLPPDLLFFMEIEGEEDVPYSIERNKLLTDESSVSILYVTREEDPTKYDDDTVQALAAYLAWIMADDLTGSLSRKQAARSIYDGALRDARGNTDAESGPEYREDHFNWLAARRAG